MYVVVANGLAFLIQLSELISSRSFKRKNGPIYDSEFYAVK